MSFYSRFWREAEGRGGSSGHLALLKSWGACILLAPPQWLLHRQGPRALSFRTRWSAISGWVGSTTARAVFLRKHDPEKVLWSQKAGGLNWLGAKLCEDSRGRCGTRLQGARRRKTEGVE